MLRDIKEKKQLATQQLAFLLVCVGVIKVIVYTTEYMPPFRFLVEAEQKGQRF